jgi:hypothetical protein
MPRSNRLELRVTAAEKAIWADAADQAGLSVSEWMRGRLNDAATIAKPRPVSAPVQDIPFPPPPPLCHLCVRIGLPACDACRENAYQAYAQVSRLCDRCYRIRTPACDACRKAYGRD